MKSDGYRVDRLTDTSNIPNERRGNTGLILLGYDGTYSENLDIGDFPFLFCNLLTYRLDV